MGLFTKKPNIGADGYQRRTAQGYAGKGPVAKLLADGWEIEQATPVTVRGTSLKQMVFLLKRKAA
jgi:hypothetical protein